MPRESKPIDYTPDSLRAAIKKIREGLDRIEVYAESMVEHKIEKITVRQATYLFEEAMTGVRSFSRALETTIDDERTRRGDFGVLHEDEGPEKELRPAKRQRKKGK